MMIKPITFYDQKRKKQDKKWPRNFRTKEIEHIVYVVRPVGSNMHKIGHTKNMFSRMSTYETASGQEFELRFQVVLADREAAKTVERELIAILSKAGCERKKREWFLLLDNQLIDALRSLISNTSLGIVETRGTIVNHREYTSSFDQFNSRANYSGSAGKRRHALRWNEL